MEACVPSFDKSDVLLTVFKTRIGVVKVARGVGGIWFSEIPYALLPAYQAAFGVTRELAGPSDIIVLDEKAESETL